MLQNLHWQTRDCLYQAAHCAERAKAAIDERNCKAWLALEASYLKLALGIEAARRLDPVLR
jgi:hypothetical protein